MRVLWLMLFACFISCNIIKTYKVLQKGSVAQENYKEVIPFEMKFGLIIIKVKIEGNTYDFILDTGAPTVVSEELMGKLNLATFSEAMASDSQGEKEKLKFVQIPKLSLQNLEFTAIGAGVVDFKKSASINAFNVYGIIGANLMRKSIWYIDFANNQITITNKKESINNLPKTYDSIEFKPNAAGTPKIKIAYNGCVENDVIFDTGSKLEAKKVYFKAASASKHEEKIADNAGVWFLGSYRDAEKDGVSVVLEPWSQPSHFSASSIVTSYLGHGDPETAKNSASLKKDDRDADDDVDGFSVLGVGNSEWDIKAVRSEFSGDDGFDVTNSRIDIDDLSIRNPTEDGMNISSSRVEIVKSLKIAMTNSIAPDRDLFDLEVDDGPS